MRTRSAGAVVLLLLAGAGTGGCAAAGLAGAPLVAAVQAVADRTVERTVLADLTTAAIATESILRRASIGVNARQIAADRLMLRGSGEKVSVIATLDRVTPTMTKVSVRTERGGLLADRQTSEHLQQQLAAALAAPTIQQARNADAEYVDAVTALRAEVRRLRDEVARPERRGPVSSKPISDDPAPRAAGPAFITDPRGIVRVPESYGLATVGLPQASGTVSAPAAPLNFPHGVVDDASPSTGPAAAAVLRPVSAIMPAGIVTDTRVGD